ncbi:MAG: RNA methylase, partial [Proteobacteria bacterium]
KLYIDGHIVHPEETLQFLPVKQDKNLLGYHSRMEEYYSDYCLVCDELLQVSHKNWNRLQKFTDTLFSYVGFPNKFVEMGLYLGNYRKTPFGVHVDGCGVFSFPVVGKKTFRIWKPEFAAKNPSLDRSLNYSKFNKHSEVMKAEPGDMTYWPSKAWHIAESSGEFSATWSLGVWVDQPHKESVQLAMAPLVATKLGGGGDERVTKFEKLQTSGEITSLPENYKITIQKLLKLSNSELCDAFMRQWAQLQSKNGFKNPPNSHFSEKLSPGATIQLPMEQLIVWTKLKAIKKILYAYQGRSVEIAPSKNFQKLVHDLNKSKRCKLATYLKGPTKKSDLKTLELLLGV